MQALEIFLPKFLRQIQLYDIFATVKRVYLVLEYASSGDLLAFINKSCVKSATRSVSEENAKSVFTSIAAGLRFIHRRDIAHR